MYRRTYSWVRAVGLARHQFVAVAAAVRGNAVVERQAVVVVVVVAALHQNPVDICFVRILHGSSYAVHRMWPLASAVEYSNRRPNYLFLPLTVRNHHQGCHNLAELCPNSMHLAVKLKGNPRNESGRLWRFDSCKLLTCSNTSEYLSVADWNGANDKAVATPASDAGVKLS